MINGKSVLGVIPARGASKRVPRKNLRIISGKPLIAWTISEAKKSKYIDRLVLSSEDPEIIAVSNKWGCEVPFVRPLELAQDDTPGTAPVLHMLQKLPEKFDYVVLLQPTSPFREIEDIDGCIEKCVEQSAFSCVSVVGIEKDPAWLFELDSMERLVSLLPNAKENAIHAYVLNGAVYVAQVSWFQQNQTFLSGQTLGFPMSEANSLDIDTENDIVFCEVFFPKRLLAREKP